MSDIMRVFRTHVRDDEQKMLNEGDAMMAA